MNKTSPLFRLLKMETVHSKQPAESATHVLKIDLVECWEVFNILLLVLLGLFKDRNEGFYYPSW